MLTDFRTMLCVMCLENVLTTHLLRGILLRCYLCFCHSLVMAVVIYVASSTEIDLCERLLLEYFKIGIYPIVLYLIFQFCWRNPWPCHMYPWCVVAMSYPGIIGRDSLTKELKLSIIICIHG